MTSPSSTATAPVAPSASAASTSAAATVGSSNLAASNGSTRRWAACRAASKRPAASVSVGSKARISMRLTEQDGSRAPAVAADRDSAVGHPLAEPVRWEAVTPLV